MFKGFLFLTGAALMFSLSTVFLKLSTAAPYHVSPAIATFVRYFIGLALFGGFVALRSGVPKPRKPRPVLLRAVLNTLAVVLFFASFKYTTVTKANILNLTYPAFVFLVAPYIAHEKPHWYHFVFMVTALLGAWLVVVPGSGFDLGGINVGDMLALASGVVSGFAIADLREACKYDSPGTILFYQMAFGAVATAALMVPSFAVPKGAAVVFILVTGLLSSAGQYFITAGYRYISATLGSIISGSGILFSALFGIIVFDDPLTLRIMAGGLLILLSLIGVSGIFGIPGRGAPPDQIDQ